MNELKKYKLFDVVRGYRCSVNIKELIFFFGLDPDANINEIKQYLQENNTGYYIQ